MSVTSPYPRSCDRSRLTSCVSVTEVAGSRSEPACKGRATHTSALAQADDDSPAAQSGDQTFGRMCVRQDNT